MHFLAVVILWVVASEAKRGAFRLSPEEVVMERFTKEPQITAAIISVIGTIVGTLLISILLGFLEGRIGLGPVVAIIVFLLLLAIWILLAYRWGLRSAGVAAAVMLVVGSVIFLGVASTRMTAIPAPTHTPITAASTTTPTLAPSPTPAATPSPQVALLYSDDFGDPSSGWSVSPSESGERGYSHGEYYVLVKEPNRIQLGWSGRTFTDFRLEVDARKVAGPDHNEFGVMVGRRDGENFCMFVISSDGRYQAVKWLNGEWVSLIPWNDSPHINRGPSANHLTLIVQGPNYSFYVNGEHLVDATDAGFAGGDIGFAVGNWQEGGSRIHFDNLEVWAVP